MCPRIRPYGGNTPNAHQAIEGDHFCTKPICTSIVLYTWRQSLLYSQTPDRTDIPGPVWSGLLPCWIWIFTRTNILIKRAVFETEMMMKVGWTPRVPQVSQLNGTAHCKSEKTCPVRPILTSTEVSPFIMASKEAVRSRPNLINDVKGPRDVVATCVRSKGRPFSDPSKVISKRSWCTFFTQSTS